MKDKQLMKILEKVLDPELGVSIVDLGFIYEAELKDKGAEIKMTLSSPMCPLSSLIVRDVETKLAEAGFEPRVELVFEPMWTPDMMSDELKKKFFKNK